MTAANIEILVKRDNVAEARHALDAFNSVFRVEMLLEKLSVHEYLVKQAFSYSVEAHLRWINYRAEKNFSFDKFMKQKDVDLEEIIKWEAASNCKFTRREEHDL